MRLAIWSMATSAMWLMLALRTTNRFPVSTPPDLSYIVKSVSVARKRLNIDHGHSADEYQQQMRAHQATRCRDSTQIKRTDKCRQPHIARLWRRIVRNTKTRAGCNTVRGILLTGWSEHWNVNMSCRNTAEWWLRLVWVRKLSLIEPTWYKGMQTRLLQANAANYLQRYVLVEWAGHRYDLFHLAILV